MGAASTPALPFVRCRQPPTACRQCCAPPPPQKPHRLASSPLPQTYFALHQLIEAHKKDFEALAAAMRGAASPAEEARLAAEVEALQRRRGGRAQRWDSAYK
jgi:hypothetical protein